VTPAAWTAFAVAGALGAVARYVVDGAVLSRARSTRPWGTFAINVAGAFVLGMLTGLALYHGLGRTPKLVLGTGFCGAFTTFSTFAYETVRLAEDGELTSAVWNVVGSLVVAALAAALGLALAGL
jgi:CrcB protein